MRDIETIDTELRLVPALRRAARERGGPQPSTAPMDELLDERLAHLAAGSARMRAPAIYPQATAAIAEKSAVDLWWAVS